MYQQIRDRLVEAIAAGALRPGEALSSVRALAGAFGINVATVSKAYDALRRDGFIRTSSKSGSVVARGPGSGDPAPPVVADWSTRVRTLLAEGLAQGMDPADVVARCHAEVGEFVRRQGAAGAGQPERER
nr:GntR family transcriptional regulator [Kineococcus siccus]